MAVGAAAAGGAAAAPSLGATVSSGLAVKEVGDILGGGGGNTIVQKKSALGELFEAFGEIGVRVVDEASEVLSILDRPIATIHFKPSKNAEFKLQPSVLSLVILTTMFVAIMRSRPRREVVAMTPEGEPVYGWVEDPTALDRFTNRGDEILQMFAMAISSGSAAAAAMSGSAGVGGLTLGGLFSGDNDLTRTYTDRVKRGLLAEPRTKQEAEMQKQVWQEMLPGRPYPHQEFLDAIEAQEAAAESSSATIPSTMPPSPSTEEQLAHPDMRWQVEKTQSGKWIGYWVPK